MVVDLNTTVHGQDKPTQGHGTSDPNEDVHGPDAALAWDKLILINVGTVVTESLMLVARLDSNLPPEFNQSVTASLSVIPDHTDIAEFSLV